MEDCLPSQKQEKLLEILEALLLVVTKTILILNIPLNFL